MNTLNTITSGIARRSQKSESPSYLDGSPSDIPSLNKLAQIATGKSSRLRELTESVLSAVAKYRGEAEERRREDGLLIGENGTITDTLGEAKRRDLLEKDVDKYRRSALAISDNERRTDRRRG